ncbi:single-stranded-DNA-specific exonuclease RecJ [Paludicola sp. MB14-C6]|uniref:single-stranded-DNA-specific exonuclease RecJ n=1 Tax=Paludihabitans sp. MB14-C6 TaxID=3070656 RepID=UPI0027DDF3C8|nr:single-stranded-DNA-specific exonuclease RecJ [Paludicola sp. MB14-C6]WMJ22387.1 single-stranded-DNA-specific exonuclease RecJ [Paludicola sp. MB14-C6]
MIKYWRIPKENSELSNILSQECQISEFAASILVNRGHTTFQAAQQFLVSDELTSPYDIKDMQKAVERIRDAIDNYEKIAIYGDYDCDGVTSTAMLYTYLSSIGADVIYYIPERDGEGYGLNKKAIELLANQDVTLIITVDNGISAIDEANFAASLNIDMVITDHHQPQDILPKAIAVVNPHRKDCKSSFKELCGAGVVFKLIAALEDGDYQTALEYFSDIVAIGTIGDIVPLVEENRALVKYGLQMLTLTENIGIRALMEVAGVNPETVTAQNIAFGLVPRINAAGRMGSASLAVKLLLCEDPQEAKEIATQLDQFNKQRQNDEQQILCDIEQMIQKDPDVLKKRVLMFYGPNWSHGIIGIVCSRILERFGKPVLLMTSEEGKLKGSARSLGEFHLFKALSANAEYLLQYGGHKLAAGFSLDIKDYADFQAGMEAYAKTQHDIMPQYTYNIDKVLTPNDITVENIQSLNALEPFGATNEQPLFLISNAKIESISPLSGDKHQRFGLKMNGISHTALLFGVSSDKLNYKVGDSVDLLVNVDINEYNQKVSVTLKIKDLRPTNFPQDKFFAAKAYYEKISKQEQVPVKILAIAKPSRDDIALLYKVLKSNNGYRQDVDTLYVSLMKYQINYCKMRIILDILNEMNLIYLSPLLDSIEMIQVNGKVDLNQSSLLQRLNS